jgi:hypothetical protein
MIDVAPVTHEVPRAAPKSLQETPEMGKEIKP